jgi:hypothetical protein
MPAKKFTTLLEIVNQVALSVGHPKTQDVPSSQDESILRLGYYANLACSELMYRHSWQQYSRTFSLDVVADGPDQTEKGFDLPVDFKALTTDTMWDNNTQLPAIGPVSAQDWQWLIARDTKITTRMMWRLREGQLWIKSPPLTAETLTFEYMSKNWAVDATTAELKEMMEASGDYHLFPWNLVVLFTRHKWFENEGYDSSATWDAFQKALAFEVGNDQSATALRLVPGAGFPYIDMIRNAPDTGYGLGS